MRRSVGGGTLTMQPGLYIMAGGGFTVGSNGSVVGPGITIFNTKAPLATRGDYQARSISFGSNGTIAVSAPTSGIYSGIVIFQDRALPRTQPKISISGGFKGTLDGVVYAINAELSASGNARLAMEMVVDTIEISGRISIIPPPNPYSLLGGTGWGAVAWLDY